MRARFADRAPDSRLAPEVLADYCAYGLLPTGAGYELACPPALEASMYQNVLRTDPYRWLGDLATPVTLIRAPSGMRGDTMDFSQSPPLPGLGPYLGAVRAHFGDATSHFLPFEDPS